VEETAAVAGKLRDQAQGLVQTVSVFKIRDGMNWTAVVPAPPPSSIRRPPAVAQAPTKRIAAAAPAPRLGAGRPAHTPSVTRPASTAPAGSAQPAVRAPAALPPASPPSAAEGEWESF
jgi:hypothetical protein